MLGMAGPRGKIVAAAGTELLRADRRAGRLQLDEGFETSLRSW